MFFPRETSSDGVRERDFITAAGIPGVLWSPPSGAAPLVLIGHGGGAHKRAPGVAGRARALVAGAGFHVAAIDAPGHGDRPRSEHDEQEIAALYRARVAGRPEGPIVERYNAWLAGRAVPEWRATLDELLDLPDVRGPVGWFGLALGTAIGVPLVAAEPRVRAAVFGLFWPDSLAGAARRITVPVEYLLQWDDEHVPRAAGLALFDAFGSPEKSLHANAGGHQDVPRFEVDSVVRFFARHLGSPGG